MAPGFFDVDEASAHALMVRPGRIPVSDVGKHSARLSAELFSPINFAGPHEVFDFTKGYDPARAPTHRYGVGRWAEDRVGMYTSALFTNGDIRSVHMGLDLQAEEGTPVFSALSGMIWGVAVRDGDGDYGGLVIVESEFAGFPVFLLYGHLSHLSVRLLIAGRRINRGELLGWLGGKQENGGWNPHLHFQMSRLEPLRVDLPGAVVAGHLELAKKVFPLPLIV